MLLNDLGLAPNPLPACMSDANRYSATTLADLPLGAVAVVTEVAAAALPEEQALALRLVEIGFIAGERIKVVAHGHPGREPIAVRIGNTTFALRRFEAQCIRVMSEASV
jgi:ferrous iron transport protein A